MATHVCHTGILPADEVMRLAVKACRLVGCDAQDLFGDNRERHITDARFLVWRIARQRTGISHERLAKLFGRERSCVTKGLKAIRQTLSVYPQLRQMERVISSKT